jgi:hypothetical protein
LAGYSAAIACDFSELFSQRVPAVFGGLFSSDCLWSSASYFGSDYQCFSANYSAAIACGFQRITQQQLPVVFSELFSSDYLWSSANYSAAIIYGFQRAIQHRLQGFSADFSAAIAIKGFQRAILPAIARVFGGLFSSDCLTGFQRAIQRRLPVILSELFSSDYLWSSVITCERLPAIFQQAIQVYFQFWLSAAVEELSQGRLHQFDLDFIDCGSGFLLLLINCGLISLACCGLLLCLLWILVLDFVLLSSSG